VSPYPSGAGSVHREGCSTDDFQDRSEKNGIDARVEEDDASVEEIDASIEDTDACVEEDCACIEEVGGRGGHFPRCHARACACGG